MTTTVKDTIMNEKLQTAVSELIAKSIQAFESGATFLSEQIPDVINQMLMWYMVSSAVQAAFAVLIGIAFLVIDYKVFKYLWAKDHDEYNWGEHMFVDYGLLGSIVRLLWLVPFFMFNLTWLKIWIAPKLFLIEYAASLVK